MGAITESRALPKIVVTCAMITNGEKALLAQRADTKLWEMPGGKLKPGETLKDCLKREIKEELDVVVKVGDFLGKSVERKPDKIIELNCFHCEINTQKPKALEHLQLRWVLFNQIQNYDLSFCDRKLIKLISFCKSPSG